MELKMFESCQHVIDSHDNTSNNNNHIIIPDIEKEKMIRFEQISQKTRAEEQICAKKREYKKDIKFITKGLCIIINEVFFEKEYSKRVGSSQDTAKLAHTFETFGFKLSINENLCRKDILKTIRDLRKTAQKYDCIFLFILSHGYKGGIISSDVKEISLEEIESTFYCMELKDVMKIVFVQACQGQICGSITNNLTTDGPLQSSRSLPHPVLESMDVCHFVNFFMFMSTIQGYVSIRGTAEGTWFIGELCEVFLTFGNKFTFLDCIRKVMLAVQRKQGTIGKNQIAQLTEVRLDRLQSDFQLLKR